MHHLLLWAQMAPAARNAGAQASRVPDWLLWLIVWGDPQITDQRFGGGLMTWAKVAGLFCLIGWVGSWVLSAAREPGGSAGSSQARRGTARRWGSLVAILAVGLVSILMQVLDQSGRVHLPTIGGWALGLVLNVAAILALVVWTEWMLWSSLRRRGRRGDLLVLTGLHLALALGLFTSIALRVYTPGMNFGWPDTIYTGARLAATFMGLVVLVRVAGQVVREALNVRWRRLYAIGWQSFVESHRRMWAPWVVLVVFGVILAFTHWFLGAGVRPAELSRLFVGSLALLCSLLLTVMVMILTPISLPNDIRHQTIYTVVSKPVRRIELIWGRLIGFMAWVTILLVIFGGISLLYLQRTIGTRITQTRAAAQRERARGKLEQAKIYDDQADQLETRMAARVPLKGVLSFIDSRGKPHPRGINVGMELESKSHIEGASPSKAIWNFGVVPDPYMPNRMLDRRIPVPWFLPDGTIEAVQNQLADLQFDAAMNRVRSRDPNLKARDAQANQAEISRLRVQEQPLRDELKQLIDKEKDLLVKARTAAPAQARRLRAEASTLHAPPIPLEMSFNVYRTTKGVLGEAVYASLMAINPNRDDISPPRALFPVHEYYTNKVSIPARILVGSRGALRIEVKCVPPNQYIGMAESDFYILARQGSFQANFLKGLFGIWLQALVLTAIGLFAGSFLSWPVALLTTIAFFIGGQVAYSILEQFAGNQLLGGGPFESLIRLLTHDNQMEQLTPTLAVILAKTADSVVLPVMSVLVYLVPNLAYLDVSNTVAEGFAVDWRLLGTHLLMGLGYALPFTVAGYYILKNREVAA